MERFLIDIPNSSLVLKILVLGCLFLIIKLFLKLQKTCLPYLITENKTRFHIQDISSLICGLVFIIVTAFCFAADLKEFAIPFSVIGAGIAFSLQEVIASIAGRIVIVTTNLYQVGDRIQIGEIQGDVINIGFMRTSLMEIGGWVKADQYSGRITHLTNAIVLKENVANYTGSFPYVWDEIVIPVRYGSNQHAAREILLTIAKQIVSPHMTKVEDQWKKVKKLYMVETPNFEPVVTLIANDNWLEFTVRYITPYNKRRNIKDQLFSKIVEAVAQTNGIVEFGSMTIEMTNIPKLVVDIGHDG